MSCSDSYEVRFERGGRLRVNRDVLVTSAASGCLMSVVWHAMPALAAAGAHLRLPVEEEASSNLSAGSRDVLLPRHAARCHPCRREDAAPGLLARAGMVAVRAADLASPCGRGLGELEAFRA